MGLYDDDKKSVTSGDVKDVIYWQAKFNHLKLDAALKTRQPEAGIKEIVPWTINLCDSVLKEYPNHAEVAAWKAAAEGIAKKLDPNPPPAEFKGNFAQWRDYSYEMGWRSYHLSKMAAADEDWGMARSHAQEAVTQLGRCVDRMGNWPEDVKGWVNSARPEMEKLEAEATARR